jgi:hypothetical protein
VLPGDAHAGVDHVDAHALATPPSADEHATLDGVAQ